MPPAINPLPRSSKLAGSGVATRIWVVSSSGKEHRAREEEVVARRLVASTQSRSFQNARRQLDLPGKK
jgi:hypothetical protein